MYEKQHLLYTSSEIPSTIVPPATKIILRLVEDLRLDNVGGMTWPPSVNLLVMFPVVTLKNIRSPDRPAAMSLVSCEFSTTELMIAWSIFCDHVLRPVSMSNA
eukprot:m.80136 g.80136  ORF g.80136 m.80136 type:complete len:103 (+) comp12743_c0_seq9:75-383(+)